jgi:hypothetical protein
MLGRKGVAKFVQEKALAIWTLGAPISVLGLALSAIQLGAMGDSLHNIDVTTVRLSL